jgi:CMP-N,N'-diacetyllegionaminic acid synthase
MNIAIIPARSGSKGVPDKNIKMLGKYPLFMHSIMAAKKCRKIDNYYLSTNSEKYIDFLSMFDEHNYIDRPDYLASDLSTDYDFLIHAVHSLKLNIDDNIILLRPTTPFRNADKIDEIIEYFEYYQWAKHSLRTIQSINESPYKMFKIDRDTVQKPIPNTIAAISIETNLLVPYLDNSLQDTNNPRQIHETAYIGNGYCDIIPVKTLIEQKDLYGEHIIAYETEKTIEIDSTLDFQIAQIYIKENNNFLG